MRRCGVIGPIVRRLGAAVLMSTASAARADFSIFADGRSLEFLVEAGNGQQANGASGTRTPPVPNQTPWADAVNRSASFQEASAAIHTAITTVVEPRELAAVGDSTLVLNDPSPQLFARAIADSEFTIGFEVFEPTTIRVQGLVASVDGPGARITINPFGQGAILSHDSTGGDATFDELLDLAAGRYFLIAQARLTFNSTILATHTADLSSMYSVRVTIVPAPGVLAAAGLGVVWAGMRRRR